MENYEIFVAASHILDNGSLTIVSMLTQANVRPAFVQYTQSRTESNSRQSATRAAAPKAAQHQPLERGHSILCSPRGR
eukprot:6203425-Pleurochrysis_carterae.AAC.1